MKLKSPFPYFGGKSLVADLVWQHFGYVRNYIEPFFGSGAMLLGRPQPFEGVEIVNDKDGYIANFWRALQDDPDAVAHYADWPVNENDLHARHVWLVERKDKLQARLEGDPDFYDANIAGWWCWGMSCWIGSGFCSGQGPWRVVKKDGVRQLVHLGNAGRGVNRKLMHLGNAGRGVNRKRMHLGNAGRGVSRKRVSGIVVWMRELAERLKRVRVCCGDWRRVCGGKSGDALKALFASGKTCAVFLDPPYSRRANRADGLYLKDDLDVADAVREWAIAHGDDPRILIAMCGYDGEHKMPRGWRCVQGHARHGYGGQSKNGYANAGRERIWFSKSCLTPAVACAG